MAEGTPFEDLAATEGWHRLRAKLGLEHDALIGTVRNVGYRFVSETSLRESESLTDA